MYEALTAYIAKLDLAKPGEWEEGQCTEEAPSQLIIYAQAAAELKEAVLAFAARQADLPDKSPSGAGSLKDGPADSDISSLDGESILALLARAARKEGFHAGSFQELLADGSVRKYLVRLREIDRNKSGR